MALKIVYTQFSYGSRVCSHPVYGRGSYCGGLMVADNVHTVIRSHSFMWIPNHDDLRHITCDTKVEVTHPITDQTQNCLKEKTVCMKLTDLSYQKGSLFIFCVIQ